MKRNKIITRIVSLSLLLVILVGCNINDLKEDDNKDNLDTSNIIISLEKDKDHAYDSSKNYINYYGESVKETKDMEDGYEFDINVDENKIIMIKNLLKEPISVEIEDPNWNIYNDLNKEYKDEYKFNRISEKGLYKVRINFLDSKKVKLDLYIVER